MALTLALCLIVGLSLGLLGAGGSILIVPIFVYTAGLAAKEAISLSLCVVSVTSFIGSIWYLTRGFINVRLVLIFSSFGSFGAFLGARFTNLFTHHTLLFIFGIIMIGTGLLMLFKKEEILDEDAMKCQPQFFSAMLTSSAIGILTGFLGVGGGFLLVPAISLIMKCDMKSAIGTSLLVISATAMAGFVGHVFDGPVEWQKAIIFSAVASFGAVLGSFWGEKTSIDFLKKSFAFLIIITGVFVTTQNFHF